MNEGYKYADHMSTLMNKIRTINSHNTGSESTKTIIQTRRVSQPEQNLSAIFSRPTTASTHIRNSSLNFNQSNASIVMDQNHNKFVASAQGQKRIDAFSYQSSEASLRKAIYSQQFQTRPARSNVRLHELDKMVPSEQQKLLNNFTTIDKNSQSVKQNNSNPYGTVVDFNSLKRMQVFHQKQSSLLKVREKSKENEFLSKRASLQNETQISQLQWNIEQSKLDLTNKMKQTSSVKLDKKEEYYQAKAKNKLDLQKQNALLNQFTFQNETHVMKSVTGFEHLEEDVEHELQPWNDHSEYDGGFQEGVKHGVGRFIYSNGDIYKGMFQRDIKQGSGTMLYKDGRFYRGGWQNDQFHGKGTHKIKGEPNSMIIEGSFEHGKLISSQVKVQYQNGEIYEGKMSNYYKREGANGKFYFLNGDNYEGEWVNDKRQGKGKLVFNNGGQFVGTFKDDEIYDGKLYDKNDNIFENDLKQGGYFLRGKLNGHGRAKFANGDEYDGEFRDGVFSGQGKLLYKNLDLVYYEEATYIGQFRNHKREGYGEMSWNVGREQYKGFWKGDQRIKGLIILNDGNTYDGEWKNDVFHGLGRLTYKHSKKDEQGIIFEGIFENGMQPIKGKLIYPNGDIYQGQIEQDLKLLNNCQSEYKRIERGIMNYTNGDIYDCQWVDDKKNGVGYILFKNGDCYKGEFREDKMEGFGTLYIAATQELYLGGFQRGQRQGFGFLIFKEKNKYFEGNFKNNKQDGQGVIINEAPNMMEMQTRFTIPEDWNIILPQIQIKRDLLSLIWNNNIKN